MNNELKLCIDSALEGLAIVARVGVQKKHCTKQEVFEYIASSGNRYFEDVFGMSRLEFLMYRHSRLREKREELEGLLEAREE